MRTIPRHLILILLIGWALLAIRSGDRLTDIREAPHVWIPAAIRNYHLYGDQIGVMMTRNTAPITNPDEIIFYSHHPAMMVWVPAVSTALLGFHETGVRFPFMAITLLTTCLLYVFTRRLFNERVAAWTAFFYLIAPFTNFFGRIAAPDVIGFLWVMCFALVIQDWLHKPKRWHLLGLGIFAWLAVWTAWTAVFFIAAFGIAAMFLGGRHHRIVIVGVGALTIMAFGALMLFYQLQWDGSINSILDAYVWRSSTTTFKDEAATFTALQWITKNTSEIIVFATGGIVFLSLAGVLALLRENRYRQGMILALFAGSLSYQLTFLNASYVHDVDKASFTLVLALLAGLGHQFWQHPKRVRWGRPLTQVAVLAIFIQGVAITLTMHNTGRVPLLNQAIELARAAPDDVQVAIYLPQIRDDRKSVYAMVAQFYSYRPIIWNKKVEEARAVVAGQPILYINCAQPDSIAATGEAECTTELLN
ncbi:MAG: glycosyltransferase family 39 protein [Anaerolineae bacterium]|nr:glycosyltransferase family 39 protein [Anaerolineae bacterium]